MVWKAVIPWSKISWKCPDNRILCDFLCILELFIYLGLSSQLLQPWGAPQPPLTLIARSNLIYSAMSFSAEIATEKPVEDVGHWPLPRPSLRLFQSQIGQEWLCRGGHRKGSEVKVQQLCEGDSEITNIMFVEGHTQPPGFSPCRGALYTEAGSSHLPQTPWRPHLMLGDWTKMAAGPAVAMVTTAPGPAGWPWGGSHAGPCGGLSSAVAGQRWDFRITPPAKYLHKSGRSLLPPQWPQPCAGPPGGWMEAGPFVSVPGFAWLPGGRVGFQLAAQHAGAECFQIINVLPYLWFNYKQFMAQSGALLTTPSKWYADRSWVLQRVKDRAMLYIIISLKDLLLFEEKGAELALSTSFSVCMYQNVGLGAGEGWRELGICLQKVSFCASISGYKPHFLVLPGGLQCIVDNKDMGSLTMGTTVLI